MPETDRCSACGAELAAGASPEGLCPQCLLKAALPSDPDEAPTVTMPPETGATPARPGGDLTPGQTFGAYRIERVLGRGGMGVVYEAEEIDSGRRVALKVLAHGLDDPADRARFLREGRLAAAISHPHTVYIFGTDEIDGTPVIAMELSSAGTLRDRVKATGPLSPGEAVDAVLQLVAGLEAAAVAGVLHRDIKPSNCFVDADGTVKVGDFGLSISTLARDETYAHLTTSGSFLGTPAFASPEQLKGDELDVRADIYSVGATVFYLLTGHTPFDDANLVKLVTKVAQDPPPSVRVLRPEVPRGLAATVARCLAKRPGDRYASYAALSRELEPYRSTAPTPATLGLRFAAGLFDYLVLGLTNGLATMAFFFTAGVNFGPSASVLFSIANILLFVAYFASCESLWGATAGKALCGLRVIGADRRPPGIARALGRAALFAAALQAPGFLFGLLLLPIQDQVWPPQTSGLIGLASLFAQLTLAGLLFSTARRKNGFAAVHELVTATRVVTRAVASRRPMLDSTIELPVLPLTGPRVGPYTVLDDVGGSDLVVGYDDRLKRKVWIHQAPVDAPPVPPVRRDLARPGRLRWLAGRRSATECWDAYEAPDGQPLPRLLNRPTGWGAVRNWLRDLAAEAHDGLADGTLPHLALDRIWITPDGRARLLEWSAPGVGASDEGSDLPARTTEPATVQHFLHDVAHAALSGRQGSDRTDGDSDVRVMPISARSLLAQLGEGRFETSASVLERVSSVVAGPATLTRARRGLHLAFSALPLATFWAMGVAMAVIVPAIMAQFRDGLALAECLRRLETLERQAEGSAGLSAADEEVRQALEVYIAGRFGDGAADDPTPSLGTDFTRVLIAARRPLLERVLESHPDPSSDAFAEAALLIEPALELAQVADFYTGGFPMFSPDGELLGIIGRKAPMSGSGLGVLFGVGFLLPIAILALLSAAVARGGLFLRLLGVAIVASDGREVSRLRAFSRAMLAWAPPLLAFTVMILTGRRLLVDPGWDFPLVAIMILLGVFIGGAVWALLHPARGMQDRIARTYLVPR